MSEYAEIAILIENQAELDEARAFAPNLGYECSFAAINEAARKIENYK